MNVIPDPIDSMTCALDSETGDLMGAVFAAPVGTPLDEMRRPENFAGYLREIELNGGEG